MHDRIISLRGEGLSHKTSLTPSPFIKVPVPSQERIDSASFYDLSIGFWIWSDSVVSFCFSFYKVSERDWNSFWKPKRFVLVSAFILIYLSILLHNIANQNCISYFEKYWLVVYFDQLFNLMIDLIFGV